MLARRFRLEDASKLKLNPDKTKFIRIGTKSQRDKFKKYFPTTLLDQDVTPTDLAQNLGVKFDKDFNFKKHISKVCRSCYYHGPLYVICVACAAV